MPSFRLLRQFEDPERVGLLRYRGSIDPTWLPHFPGDGLHDRFARALARRRAVPFKEVLESFEFFARVRKHVRTAELVDLCAGHGLVGVLFALFERRVERVLLVDRVSPGSRDAVLEAAIEVGPWVEPKLRQERRNLRRSPLRAEPGSAVVAVHACGTLSDLALEVALESRGPVALLPCCRPHRRSPAPPAVARAVGADVAWDIDRTYRLEREGYHVRWDAVPEVITPMNRVIVGYPRAEERSAQASPSEGQRAGTSSLGGVSA